jgi:uncharacterized DUF497 family protein
MARAGPRKVRAYSREFKLTAVRLSRQPGIQVQAVAESVFADDHALLIDDPDHSEAEERFVLLGLSAKLRVLVVVHCYREDEAVIRII